MRHVGLVPAPPKLILPGRAASLFYPESLMASSALLLGPHGEAEQSLLQQIHASCMQQPKNGVLVSHHTLQLGISPMLRTVILQPASSHAYCAQSLAPLATYGPLMSPEAGASLLLTRVAAVAGGM